MLRLITKEGVQDMGRFFQPLGITYILSIGASLLVALTVTPALAKVLLRSRLRGAERETFVIRWLKALYRPALLFVVRFRKTTVAAALVLTGLSIWLASTFGASFLPEFNEGTFTVFVMAPPGTSLEESNRIAQGVERRIAKLEGVRSVVRRTGRAERDEHAEPASVQRPRVWGAPLPTDHTRSKCR